MNAVLEGLQHEIEYKNTVRFELNITVPWGTVDSKLNEYAKKIKQTIPIPGYRPGKAPLSLIRTMFRKALEAEVEKWIPEVVQQVTDELKLDLLGDVKILEYNILDEAPMAIACEGMVWPKVKLLPFSSVPIDSNWARPLVNIENEVIEQEMRTQLERAAVLQPVAGRKSRADDTVRLRVKAIEVDSQRPITPEEGEIIVVNMYNPSLHPAFRTHLENLEPNAQVSWDMDVFFYSERAEDNKELYTFRRIHFDVHLEGIYEVNLPDTKEFMEQEGYDNEEEWKEALKDKLAAKIAERKRSKEREILLDPMSESEPDIPDFLILPVLSDVSREFFSRTLKAYENVMLVLADREKLHPEVYQESRKRLTRELILHDLIRQNNIQAEDKDVESYIEKLASSRGLTPAYFKAMLQQMPEEEKQIRQEATKEKALEFLKQKLGLTPSSDEAKPDPSLSQET